MVHMQPEPAQTVKQLTSKTDAKTTQRPHTAGFAGARQKAAANRNNARQLQTINVGEGIDIPKPPAVGN